MALTGSASKASELAGNIESGGTLLGKAASMEKLRGHSAFEVAVINGFSGTEEEWLASLKGKDFKYEDFTEDQLEALTGPPGYTPKKGIDYTDGYTPVKGKDYFDGNTGYTPVKGKDYFDGSTPVKGKDYYTEAEKQAFVAEVIAAVKFDINTAKIGSVSLPASAWATRSSNLYAQVVSIAGTTAYSQVDLTPSVEQLAVFYEKDLTFVTENEDGVVTVYAIGQKPTNDYTIQVTITEVSV